ncbi:hypothetical protein AMAG_12657 [Allomyces macrogynus ATCC 38327]|uniref:Prokaryotic-type class I peptide chain release factors domain-containing protein n=1 Tax=Allomyces macrogynus (strain ATCC 38327) TaxID=578462 RepID=A0A0L0T1I4_ALLM3|nr:hypothetical protein AMAG_12657 [Allomyces macrogynus ATCC 38327]|eukprot:KNE68480.1 hypothetical protein AMAG_12657 [Allomyces macrogynus ATCC 38327]
MSARPALRHLTHRLAQLAQVYRVESAVADASKTSSVPGNGPGARQTDPAVAIHDVAQLSKIEGQRLARFDRFREFETTVRDLEELYGLVHDDPAGGISESDLVDDIHATTAQIEDAVVAHTMTDHLSPSPCLLTITAGAGGADSADWSHMLASMYEHHAHLHGLTATILDQSDRTSVLEVAGGGTSWIARFPYGAYKHETGVHRLVRLSPFDAKHARHTSFAAVAVEPIGAGNGEGEVKVDMADVDVQVFRASGKGGQHVNKTESAVRLVHKPTGLVAQSQHDRSQHRNKATALRLLQYKLMQLQKQQRDKEKTDQYAKTAKNAFGSQIRSYVLHPYQMVKDHATGYSTTNAQAVLDGDAILDEFLFESLVARSAAAENTS